MPTGVYKRKPISDATKQKIRLAHLGKKSKFSAWNKGLKNTGGFSTHPEVRFKGTIWNKGLKGFRAGEKHDWMPKGEAHWNYKKDRNLLKKYDRRNDPAYKGWRIDVYRRDGYKCKINNQECVGKIEAHHILSWKDYSELRYDINNGITLCYFHHPRTRNSEKELSPYFNNLISTKK